MSLVRAPYWTSLVVLVVVGARGFFVLVVFSLPCTWPWFLQVLPHHCAAAPGQRGCCRVSRGCARASQWCSLPLTFWFTSSVQLLPTSPSFPPGLSLLVSEFVFEEDEFLRSWERQNDCLKEL